MVYNNKLSINNFLGGNATEYFNESVNIRVKYEGEGGGDLEVVGGRENEKKRKLKTASINEKRNDLVLVNC